jgi:von Willebrand factor type A domain
MPARSRSAADGPAGTEPAGGLTYERAAQHEDSPERVTMSTRDDVLELKARMSESIIVFGDAPYPQVPFTLDHATVREMIAEMLPGMAGPRTALGDSIGLAIKMFEKSHAAEKVLVVLTDGNDTASRMPPVGPPISPNSALSRSIPLPLVIRVQPERTRWMSPRCSRSQPQPAADTSSDKTRTSLSRFTPRSTG